MPRPRFTLAADDDRDEGVTHDLAEEGEKTKDGTHTKESGGVQYTRDRTRTDAPDSAPPTSSTIEKQSTGASKSATGIGDKSKPNIIKAFFIYQLSWIKPKITWKSARMVTRCAIAAWAGLILMLARDSQQVLGQSSFFVIVGRCRCNNSLCFLSFWINR
jgi:hypothetical protein